MSISIPRTLCNLTIVLVIWIGGGVLCAFVANTYGGWVIPVFVAVVALLVATIVRMILASEKRYKASLERQYA